MKAKKRQKVISMYIGTMHKTFGFWMFGLRVISWIQQLKAMVLKRETVAVFVNCTTEGCYPIAGMMTIEQGKIARLKAVNDSLANFQKVHDKHLLDLVSEKQVMVSHIHEKNKRIVEMQHLIDTYRDHYSDDTEKLLAHIVTQNAQIAKLKREQVVLLGQMTYTPN